MALLRAREAVMRHFRATQRHYDLSEQQWRVLRTLCQVGDMEVTDLARATFLLAPSLSRILRDLEQRGLVSRHLVESDLRRSLVSVSSEGARLMESASVPIEAIYAEITRQFGADKLAALQAMLSELETLLLETAPAERDYGEAPPLQAPGRRRGRPRKTG